VPSPGGSLEAYAVESRRFLNEVGDQAAVEPATCPAARKFDVRVEMLAAIERIEGGVEANAYVDAHRQGCWVVEIYEQVQSYRVQGLL